MVPMMPMNMPMHMDSLNSAAVMANLSQQMLMRPRGMQIPGNVGQTGMPFQFPPGSVPTTGTSPFGLQTTDPAGAAFLTAAMHHHSGQSTLRKVTLPARAADSSDDEEFGGHSVEKQQKKRRTQNAQAQRKYRSRQKTKDRELEEEAESLFARLHELEVFWDFVTGGPVAPCFTNSFALNAVSAHPY
jgi:hypothetical protein